MIKKYGTFTDNSQVTKNLKKIENRVTFKIKREYHLEILPSETMELVGSTKGKINKDKKW